MSGLGRRGCLLRGELLGLLALQGGVGGAALASISVGKDEVGFRIGGVGGYGSLKLGYGFGGLATLEQRAATVQGEVGTLAADGDAAEIGGYLTFLSCASGVALTN